MNIKKFAVVSACILLASPAYSAEQETLVAGAPSSVAGANSLPGGGDNGVKAGDHFVGIDSVTSGALQAQGVTLEDVEPGPHPLSELVKSELAGAGAESVINFDARLRQNTTQYPQRAIVYITRNGFQHCTGWMIGADTLATAGHCVHTGGSSGSFYAASSFRVYPGYDLGTGALGSCTVSQTFASSFWTSTGGPANDWGAMKLNCTVGNSSGWFGLYSKNRFKGEPAIISGYPGDIPGKQMLGADKIRATQTNRLCYRVDTAGGQSGSPIFHDRKKATHSTGFWAFGIHAYGAGTCGGKSNMNSGTWITKSRITLLKSIINM